MVELPIKKVKGLVEELNPTTIKVAGKTIYLPQDKREYLQQKNFSIGDGVKIDYTSKGDLITADPMTAVEYEKETGKKQTPKPELPKTQVEEKEVHIDIEIPPQEIPQSTVAPIVDMHIQDVEQSLFVTDEINLITSLLAISTEIVNNPETKPVLENQLKAKCDSIIIVCDILYDYVKGKVNNHGTNSK